LETWRIWQSEGGGAVAAVVPAAKLAYENGARSRHGI